MDSSPTTSFTTRLNPNEKSAEFARLYYFFEKLTQPRNNYHHHQSSTSREDSETTAVDRAVPEDIAPLLKNLSAILTKDEPTDRDGDAPLLRVGASDAQAQVSIPEMPATALASTFAAAHLPTPTPTSGAPQPGTHLGPVSPDYASTRPRRNTVAASAPAPASETQPQTRTRFPLREKRYPFTFKLLLHKLYDLDDWAAKVQEVLAASQEQFRSLNDTPPPSPAQDSDSGSNGCSDSRGGPCSPGSPVTTFSGSLFGPTSPSLESPPLTTTSTRRWRAQSSSRTKTGNDTSAMPTTRCGDAVTPSRPPRQPTRAVKKRIVNRRRSTNGLGEGVVGKMGEWMYDAAVSSVDAEHVDARGGQDSLRRRKRVLSSVWFAEEERRFAGRNVTNVSF